MNIVIAQDIREKLSAFRLGIMRFSALVESSSESFWNEVDDASQNLQSKISVDEITKITTITETRSAYKKCGKDPSRYRPSADSLVRRIIKGNKLYKVNNVVDLLNLVSIKTGFSIGGYDVSKIIDNSRITIGTSEDDYYGIGRGKLNIEGLPVLRDKMGVFGSPTSDSERTMITEKTNEIAFVFFDFGVSSTLAEALESTSNLLTEYCGVEDIQISYVQD